MKKTKKPKTYAFMDATNIIYGAKNAGFKVDFKKLKKYLNSRYNVSKIFYYAGVDQANKKQLSFYKKLASFGYLLKLVPVKTFKDGKKKADVDSRMTFEIMLYFDHFDQVILMSGDGDFFWVFEYLVKKKTSVKLFAHRRSTAKELKGLFGVNFTDLKFIKEFIERKQKNAVDSFKVSTARDYENNITKKIQNVKRVLTRHR